MQTRLAVSLCVLASAACASDPDAELGDGLQIRGGGAPVTATDFTCRASNARALTPCYDGGIRSRGVRSESPAPGVVKLRLGRSSNAADGGEVNLVLALQFSDSGRLIEATATQEAVFELAPPPPEAALGGWLQPVATSPTATGRSAGRFSVDFGWGTVAGTYDTDDVYAVER